MYTQCDCLCETALRESLGHNGNPILHTAHRPTTVLILIHSWPSKSTILTGSRKTRSTRRSAIQKSRSLEHFQETLTKSRRSSKTDVIDIGDMETDEADQAILVEETSTESQEGMSSRLWSKWFVLHQTFTCGRSYNFINITLNVNWARISALLVLWLKLMICMCNNTALSFSKFLPCQFTVLVLYG